MKARLSIVLCLLAALCWGQGRVITYYAAAANSNATTPPPPVDTAYSTYMASWYDAAKDSLPVPSWQQRRSLDTALQALDAINWLDSLDDFRIFGNNAGLAFGKFNIIDPDSNVGRYQSVLHVPDSGFVSNGSFTSHFNTRYTPSTDAHHFRLDNAMFGWYCTDDPGRATGNTCDMGNVDNINGRAYGRSLNSGNAFTGDLNSSGNQIGGGTNPNPIGIITYERIGTQINIWKDGEIAHVTSATIGQLPTGDMYVGAAKNGGNVLNSSPSTYGASWIGAAVSEEQHYKADSILKHLFRRLAHHAAPVVEEGDNGNSGSPAPTNEWATIENPEAYSRSASIIDVNDFNHFHDQYGNLNVYTRQDSNGVTDSIYINSFDQAFALDQWVFDGTTPIGVVPGYKEKGDMLNFISKSAFRYPWHKEADFKYYTTIDSIGFYDDGVFSPNSGYNARWLEIQGRSCFTCEWVTLIDSIEYTNTHDWKHYPVTYTDSLVSIKVIRHRLDGAGFLDLPFREKLLISIVGNKGSLAPDLNPLPELGSTMVSYREGKGSNNLVTTDPDKFTPYLATSRMYNDWANFIPYERYTGHKFIASPYGFGSSKANDGSFDSEGIEPLQIRYYLHDENHLDDYRDAGTFQIFLIQNKIRDRVTYDPSVNSEWVITEDSIPGGYYKHGDSTWSYIGRPEKWNYSVALFDAINDTSWYDLPKDTIEGQYQKYLPGYSDFAKSVTVDTISGSAERHIYSANALYNAMPVDNVFDAFSTWPNLQKRDSAMLAKETWDMAATLAFTVTALNGRNSTVPREDIENYLIPKQQYVVGRGTMDAVSFAQEANKFWEGGSAHFRAKWYGKFLSYVYDGNMNEMNGPYGNGAVGVWNADTSMMLSVGADIFLEGDYMKEALRWMVYYRTKRYNELKSGGDTLSPYNNIPYRILPKLHIDVHHYPGSNGGQGGLDVDILDPDALYTHAVAPEDMHWEKFEAFVRYVLTEMAPDCLFSVSEYAYGGNDGAPYSIRLRDIGRKKPGMEDYIECSARRYINPNDTTESCDKDENNQPLYKLAYEVYDMILAHDTGSADVDSTIGYGFGAMLKAMDYRMEMMFTYHGCPRFEYFTISELGYPTPRTITDTGYYELVGVPSNQFTFQGLYNSYNHEFTTGTYAWRNLTATMGDFVLNGMDINDSMVTATYFNKLIDNEYAIAVWHRGIKVDTIHQYNVEFPAGSYEVTQHQPFVPRLGSKTQLLGEVTSSVEDILIKPKFFIYRNDN